jgi:AraC-like DNA-binding protein
MANGNLWTFQIQDGFFLSCLNIKAKEKLSLEHENDRPTLNFGFVLSGNFTNRIKAPGFTEKDLSNQKGISGINYLPCQEGELVIPPQTHIRVIHVHLSQQVFYDLFYADRASIPKALTPLLDGPAKESYLFRAGMSMETRSVLDRLVKGPSAGIPERLFYQGMALGLISEQIRQNNTMRRPPGPMSFDEQERVIQARHLLIQDLAFPPCLKELSRKVGLNMNKLQQGFHQLYGLSVFKYLHQYRMQEANRIFHETDMNVSQAASAVGYTNVSHFSRAYTEHFSILPKKHLALIKG